MLRVISWFAFAFAMLAFTAYYGYPAQMNRTWHFFLLPMIAAATLLLSTLGMALPLEPTRAEPMRGRCWVPFAANGLMLMFCFGLIVILYANRPILVIMTAPRVGIVILTIWLNWLLAAQFHGTTRGRRLLAVAAGFGMLQAMNSITDTMFVEFAD